MKSNTMNIQSALRILMVWCIGTRAVVATMLSIHQCFSSSLWVNKCYCNMYNFYCKTVTQFPDIRLHWFEDTVFFHRIYTCFCLEFIPVVRSTELTRFICYISRVSCQKGPYPPCLRMADRALFAGYPRFVPSLQGCFIDTGAITLLPQCQWSSLEKYG